MVGRRNFAKSTAREPIQGFKTNLDTVRNGHRLHGRERFRDIVENVVEDGRRDQIKKKLLEGLKSGDMERFRKSDEELKEIKNKKVRAFYENQNERLNDWLEVDTLVRHVADDVFDSFDPHDEDGDGVPEPGRMQQAHDDVESFLPKEVQDNRRKGKKRATWAININVIANICLLIAKIIAAFYSGSLSLLASLVDSALDLLCTVIIWSTSKLVGWKIASLSKRFPIGRRRLEPIGILLFSVIMVISFIEILQESVKKLMPGSPREAAELPPTAIFAMLSTIVVKGIIWIGCARVKTTQVQALAQDCKTDVIFNTISLLFPFIGHKANIWWFDPVGAGLLSLYIIYDWSATCLENALRLTGIGVDDELLTKLMFLAWRFTPIVDGFKSISAYHAGDGVWCEVDLLLGEKTHLEQAHDVAETLQYCLESLDEVDRAFVTVDYAKHGPTGHSMAV